MDKSMLQMYRYRLGTLDGLKITYLVSATGVAAQVLAGCPMTCPVLCPTRNEALCSGQESHPSGSAENGVIYLLPCISTLQ